MYDIKLLGPGQIYYDGKAIKGFPEKQYCLLFFYLLLDRQVSHTREQIATVFWRDEPPAKARKNLRHSLWQLSQSFQSVGGSLEDLLTIQRYSINFMKTKAYRLDIDILEEASQCSVANSSQDISPEQVSMLEAAVDVYKGDLLDGVYEDWCLYERERLQSAFLNILISLMNYHRQQGNYERGLEYGRQILSRDPSREKVHREMIVIHCLAGNRDAALRQYHSCSELLQTELGLKPTQETQYLYEKVLHSPSFRAELVFSDTIYPKSITNMESDLPFREMLQKLHFLEMIVEQMNTELYLLEKMIRRTLEAK